MYFGHYIEKTLMILEMTDYDITVGNTERHLWYSSSFREIHLDFRQLIGMIKEKDSCTKLGYLDLLRSIIEEVPRMRFLIDYLIECAHNEETPENLLKYF